MLMMIWVSITSQYDSVSLEKVTIRDAFILGFWKNWLWSGNCSIFTGGNWLPEQQYEVDYIH